MRSQDVRVYGMNDRVGMSAREGREEGNAKRVISLPVGSV